MNPLRTNRADLYQRTAPTVASSLLTGLSLSLDFENAGNLGLDRTGQNNLTNTGAVAAAAGHVGSGAAVWNGAAKSLNHADAPSLQVGSGDFTIGFWIQPQDPGPGASYTVIAKWTDAAPEYEFAWNRFGQVWNWRVGLSSAANQVQITTGSLPLGGAFYWVELFWIHASATVGVSVNNGAPVTTVGTVVSPVTANPLLIGGTDGGAIGGPFIGTLDNVNIWQRLLTPAERAFLASGAPGTEYPF